MTDKRNENAMNQLRKQTLFVEYVLNEKKKRIWFCCSSLAKELKKITTINQEQQKLEHILQPEPQDYHIDYVISMELLTLRRRRPFCESSIALERSGKRRLYFKVQIARLLAISELRQASVSRRGQVQAHWNENYSFILMQIIFIFTRKICTRPHFESDSFQNSEVVYLVKIPRVYLSYILRRSELEVFWSLDLKKKHLYREDKNFHMTRWNMHVQVSAPFCG